MSFANKIHSQYNLNTASKQKENIDKDGAHKLILRDDISTENKISRVNSINSFGINIEEQVLFLT